MTACADSQVRGHCPMGCGETLFVASGGYLTCSWHKCPNPTAVADLLEHRETEHIVDLGPTGFTIKHPLRERLEGDLFECGLHARIAALDGPSRQSGRYRVTVFADGGWAWSRIDGAPRVSVEYARALHAERGGEAWRQAALHAATTALLDGRWRGEDRAGSAHRDHVYDGGCAVCTGDLTKLLPVVLDAFAEALAAPGLADVHDDEATQS